MKREFGSGMAIVCRHLSKNFGTLAVLKGLNLEIKPGEIVAVVGPSGSGKSTLLHLLGLMEKPTSGALTLFSRASNDLTENEASNLRLNWVGFMFQFHYLLPELSVLENVLIPCRLAGEPLSSSRKKVLELIQRLGLAERIEHKPHELSGGEQQRTALARALIKHPRLLLCDEPTGNLDREKASQIQALIWSESRRLGATVILATHNESLAERADRIFQLMDGQAIEVKKTS